MEHDSLEHDSFESADHEAMEEGDLLPEQSVQLIDSTKMSSIKKAVFPTRKSSQLVTASLTASVLAKPSDDRRTSSLVTGWTVSSIIQGTGILGIPFAVQQGGWVGFATIFIVAMICGHTAKLLVKCMYETSRHSGQRHRLRVNFPEIGEAAYGRGGKIFVEIVQTIEMSGATIMYIVLLGETVQDMFKNVLNFGFNEFAAMTCIVILPLLFIRRISIISLFSALAGIMCVFAVITLLAFCFTEHERWRLSNVCIFNPTTFPIGFGIIVFSYCGHAAFPSIEGSMRKPEQYNVVMDVSFFVAAVIKGALGICMVLAYGHETEQVATVNLQHHVIFSRAATIFVIINAFLTLPLVMFVVSELFDDKLIRHFPHMNKDSKFFWLWLVITRPLLLGFGLLISLIVPHFALVMGFVGNISGTFLSFICPCVFYMKLHWRRVKVYEVFICGLIIVFGVVAGGMGTVYSGKALVESFSL